MTVAMSRCNGPKCQECNMSMCQKNIRTPRICISGDRCNSLAVLGLHRQKVQVNGKALCSKLATFLKSHDGCKRSPACRLRPGVVNATSAQTRRPRETLLCAGLWSNSNGAASILLTSSWFAIRTTTLQTLTSAQNWVSSKMFQSVSSNDTLLKLPSSAFLVLQHGHGNRP